jgi:hypothetical protein
MRIIDRFLGKWASRKLLMLVIATLFVVFDKMDGSDWKYIAMAYVFVQGVIDAKDYFLKN